ncbi:hypothetical protein CW304_18910 [Bacillus sp. UFRGS-B20]|nr:hypothetical protein CW304_18910 [Bacillus sp. UFRGS-B20]
MYIRHTLLCYISSHRLFPSLTTTQNRCLFSSSLMMKSLVFGYFSTLFTTILLKSYELSLTLACYNNTVHTSNVLFCSATFHL